MSLSTRTEGSLLREPGFRSFFVAHSVSQFGDRISELAFPLIAVLVLDATAVQVSILTALVWLPNLLSVFLGAWVDSQVRKKRLLVVADLVRAALLVTVPLAVVVHGITLPHLYVVALLTGAGAVLFNTTYPAFFVLIVRRQQYIAANSLLSGSRSVAFIGGPAVGGALIQALTAPVALLVDAVSFVVSALFIGRIRPDRAAGVADEPGEPSTLLRQSWEGLTYTLRDAVLRGALGCATTLNFFTFVSGALLVLFASRELGLSSGVIGLALGLGAFGGLLGAVLAPTSARRLGLGRTVVIGGIVFPAAFALAAVAEGPLWARAGLIGAAEFVGGIGVMLFDVNLNALFATVIPDGMRSRVSGAFSAVNYGVRPLGAIVGGVLGTWLGLRPTLWIAAIGGALCVLWLLPSPIPGIRSLAEYDEPVTG